MVIVNCRNIKKYAKYISVYIKVKIVEAWKYNLSCMSYYIVVAISRAQLVNDLVIINDVKWIIYKL